MNQGTIIIIISILLFSIVSISHSKSIFELDNSTYFDRYIENMKNDAEFTIKWNEPEYDTYDWSQFMEIFDEYTKEETKS